jgi:hypothetical protein
MMQPMVRRNVVRLAVAWLFLLLAACATGPDRGSELREAQYAWSAAIRWGDFEGAWTMVDPAYREAHPMTPLEFERYRQIQVSAYHEGASQAGPDSAMREIELGVVNRNTQVQRQARFVERWRYDAEAHTWWITGGLPEFWAD